ncbi:mandelate racemase/muconate lactonizing enzyme family protein [Gordonia McavH-238-E]|uniref:mandelate racemase/muconate lactonizing enzyme family protein n=1 Tax=Gordonia sp. McavH-238-E TaxID=2917736 RepID=UPI001EF44776|nr:mandelate racemase/muconate lactonizing enzyme family protein [Gordonia sp. McavH-238-E]MCG7632935.1 mandelate racemase/muconate lactonizing enzyme family protein [Gordonia sp. McavH-238-E]
MRITSVEVIRLNSGRSPVPGAAWHPTVVRVNTDEGVSGLGEIGLAYSQSRHGSFGAAQDFAELVVGQDPMAAEALWERMFRDSFWGLGGGGFIFGAISAIDIALWDIRGKVLDVPVYQLLGGKTNTQMRSYASQLQLDWGVPCHPLVDPREYGEAAGRAMAEGFDCIKVNPIFFGPTGEYFDIRYTGMLDRSLLKAGVDRVKAIREVGGDDLDIIIELHSLTDVNTAVQLGGELEEFRILFCEEPSLPLDPSGAASIARKLPFPLSGGERVYGRWGYKPYLQSGALRIIQPDVGNCGGLTEAKKICDMARSYDVAVQAHVCGGPIAVAAALHLEAAIPNFVIHEHHAAAAMQENIELGTHDHRPRDGVIEVPELPGLGQELSADALRRADIITVA